MKGLPASLSNYVPFSERPYVDPPPEQAPPARFGTWHWFCKACTGMTLAQIEEVSGVPWGTLLAWGVDDKIPEDVYLRGAGFRAEEAVAMNGTKENLDEAKRRKCTRGHAD